MKFKITGQQLAAIVGLLRTSKNPRLRLLALLVGLAGGVWFYEDSTGPKDGLTIPMQEFDDLCITSLIGEQNAKLLS